MAQKKITDLQLISAVTSGLSVPGDDGIQSYRFTAAQMKDFILAAENVTLAMLALNIFNGLTSVSAADDDYFVLADTSDSNKTKKALVSTFARNLYRAVSTYPATVTSSDGTLKLSGSSGTITLPANGSPGKRYKFLHAGTSLTQVYTLATTGGATIGGIASGSYALYTNGEVLEVEDDGTNWIIVNRKTQTPRISYTPAFTGFGTPTDIEVYWERNGPNMIIWGRFTPGTCTATEARLGLPSGATSSSDFALLQVAGAATRNALGSGQQYWLIEPGVTYLTGSTKSSSELPYTKRVGNAFTSSGDTMALINVTVPIAGWQP